MIAALISRALSLLRRMRRASVLLRLGIGAAGMLAVLATTLPAWDAPDGYVAIGIVAAAACVVAPDTAAAMVLAFAVAMCWLVRGTDEVSAAVVLAALGLLGVHVGTALVASFPATGTLDVAVLRRWAGDTAICAAVVVVVAGSGAALAQWTRPGSVVLTIVALLAISALAWWWSAVGRGRLGGVRDRR